MNHRPEKDFQPMYDPQENIITHIIILIQGCFTMKLQTSE